MSAAPAVRMIAVPFILSDLRARPEIAAAVDPRAVDLLDLPTTLLALAGVEPAAGMRGRDLLSGAEPSARDLVAELHADEHFEADVAPRSQRLSLVRWPARLVLDRKGEIARFDTGAAGPTAPPAGARELAAAARGLVKELDAELAAGPIEPIGPLDAKKLEELRALGYAE